MECPGLEANIRWADVFILMYSVTDKCSFDECSRLKFLINYNKRRRRLSSTRVSFFFYFVFFSLCCSNVCTCVVVRRVIRRIIISQLGAHSSSITHMHAKSCIGCGAEKRVLQREKNRPRQRCRSCCLMPFSYFLCFFLVFTLARRRRFAQLIFSSPATILCSRPQDLYIHLHLNTNLVKIRKQNYSNFARAA